MACIPRQNRTEGNCWHITRAALLLAVAACGCVLHSGHAFGSCTSRAGRHSLAVPADAAVSQRLLLTTAVACVGLMVYFRSMMRPRCQGPLQSWSCCCLQR